MTGQVHSAAVPRDRVGDREHVRGHRVGRVPGPAGRMRALVLPAQIDSHDSPAGCGQRLEYGQEVLFAAGVAVEDHGWPAVRHSPRWLCLENGKLAASGGQRRGPDALGQLQRPDGTHGVAAYRELAEI